eukprot:TRINITY_DN35690_c0_g1_i1.p2 TRINITY_DN35690_c0_g1~~TRINITY_DN35690_c0_g1_i1.p2  ORF type:complete len:191 (+),score=32.00 TRINITY_DN35690_c0_g1_i1:58-630(+)
MNRYVLTVALAAQCWAISLGSGLAVSAFGRQAELECVEPQAMHLSLIQKPVSQHPGAEEPGTVHGRQVVNAREITVAQAFKNWKSKWNLCAGMKLQECLPTPNCRWCDSLDANLSDPAYFEENHTHSPTAVCLIATLKILPGMQCANPSGPYDVPDEAPGSEAPGGPAEKKKQHAGYMNAFGDRQPPHLR